MRLAHGRRRRRPSSWRSPPSSCPASAADSRTAPSDVSSCSSIMQAGMSHGHVLARRASTAAFSNARSDSSWRVLVRRALMSFFSVGQRVKFGNVLCKLVVQLGLDGLLDLVDLALEGRGLAGQLLGVVVLGERDLDGLLVAGLRADELILEAGDERAGAEVEVVLLRLAALKRLAVDKALEVDDNGVAVLCFALDGLDAGSCARPYGSARRRRRPYRRTRPSSATSMPLYSPRVTSG